MPLSSSHPHYFSRLFTFQCFMALATGGSSSLRILNRYSSLYRECVRVEMTRMVVSAAPEHLAVGSADARGGKVTARRAGISDCNSSAQGFPVHLLTPRAGTSARSVGNPNGGVTFGAAWRLCTSRSRSSVAPLSQRRGKRGPPGVGPQTSASDALMLVFGS